MQKSVATFTYYSLNLLAVAAAVLLLKCFGNSTGSNNLVTAALVGCFTTPVFEQSFKSKKTLLWAIALSGFAITFLVFLLLEKL